MISSSERELLFNQQKLFLLSVHFFTKKFLKSRLNISAFYSEIVPRVYSTTNLCMKHSNANLDGTIQGGMGMQGG